VKGKEPRWLRLRPVVANQLTMSLVAGSFYVSGAVLAALTTLWPGLPVDHRWVIRAIAAAAAMAGALPWQSAIVYQAWGLGVLAADSAVFHVLSPIVSVGLAIAELVTAFVVALLVKAAGAAEIDTTTGLRNRRGFDRELAVVISAVQRGHGPLSVAFLDLDHFKVINDTAGHGAGDRRLRAVADAWVPLLPEGAVLARQGGDEFAILFPGLNLTEAASAAEAMRAAIAGAGHTCSGGVAEWEAGVTGSTLMSRADIALYRAKGVAETASTSRRSRSTRSR
jgi:diguanylate cyclase (GGDEF)-like protein